MTTSEATRNDAYYSLEHLSESRARVMRAVIEHGPVSDADIAEILGWTINRVTGRRSELVSLGMVAEAGTKVSGYGKRVVTWVAATPKDTRIEEGQAVLSL